jgi:hypothetical protein
MNLTQKLIWNDFLLFGKVVERVKNFLGEGQHVIAVLGGKFALCATFKPAHLDSKRLTEDAIKGALEMIEEANLPLPEVRAEGTEDGEKIFAFIVWKSTDDPMLPSEIHRVFIPITEQRLRDAVMQAVRGTK